jgi:hypothetical protein
MDPRREKDMLSQQHPAIHMPRPDFMVTLGLLPPYTVADVHRAYREKAKAAHPDAGGDPIEFERLHEAYERGQEYAKFSESRRTWLGAQVEGYIRREAVARAVEQRGGHVDLQRIEWLRQELGEDFAQVTDLLVGIHLAGPAVGDEAIDFLLHEQDALKTLHVLDLSSSRITDEGLARLRVFTSLRQLDLRGTPVSLRGLQRLLPLPHLKWLYVGGTAVTWWGRLWLRWFFPYLHIIRRMDQPGRLPPATQGNGGGRPFR